MMRAKGNQPSSKAAAAQRTLNESLLPGELKIDMLLSGHL